MLGEWISVSAVFIQAIWCDRLNTYYIYSSILPKCWLYRVIEPFPFPPLAHCCIVITVVVGIEEHELAVDGDTEAKSWLTFTSRWFNELFWLNELFSRVLSTWFKVGEVFTATLNFFGQGLNRVTRGFETGFFHRVLKFIYSVDLITVRQNGFLGFFKLDF